MGAAPNQTTRGSASLSPPSVAVIYNVATTANVEVGQAFATSTKKIDIKCRGKAQIEYAYTALSAVWITIPRGKSELIDGVNFSGTIYFKTSEDDTLEITQWV